MKKTIYTLAFALTAGIGAFAQDAEESKDTGKFSISGYLDSYYNYGLQNSKYSNVSGAAGTARAFDKTSNQFSLGLAQTKFSYVNDKSELVIDLVFGPNAALGNFGAVPRLTGYINPVSSGGQAYGEATYITSMAIKQAYFSYKITEKLGFTVGQFGTHIGYEVIDAPVNFNYSLSNLFNNGPFYHVGAKLNYSISDKLGVMVGVVNNWDNLYDYKTQKSLVAQLSLSPIEGWSIYLNWIGGYGDDQFKIPRSASRATGLDSSGLSTLYTSPNGASYTRNLFDLTTGYQITDKAFIGLNAAYGFYSFNTKDSTDKNVVEAKYGKSMVPWYGAALYANYALTDMFSIGIRAEHFNDKYAVRYIGVINNSLTLTTPITLAEGHLVIKPELRYDVTPSFVYLSNEGGLRRDQTTIGVAFIYKY